MKRIIAKSQPFTFTEGQSTMPNEHQEMRYLNNSLKYAKKHKERSALINASAFRKFFNTQADNRFTASK